MMATKPEPRCVEIKRRGAEHVARLIAGMSLAEQLAYWKTRTEAMQRRQAESRVQAEQH
jgi:hypothetical protein